MRPTAEASARELDERPLRLQRGLGLHPEGAWRGGQVDKAIHHDRRLFGVKRLRDAHLERPLVLGKGLRGGQLRDRPLDAREPQGPCGLLRRLDVGVPQVATRPPGGRQRRTGLPLSVARRTQAFAERLGSVLRSAQEIGQQHVRGERVAATGRTLGARFRTPLRAWRRAPAGPASRPASYRVRIVRKASATSAGSTE